MNHLFPQSSTLGVLAAGAALVLSAACGPADTTQEPGPVTSDEPKGTFTYQPPPATPDEIVEPIVELRYEGGLIKNPDPTPFVRVYPGGRVLIHYPAYMKKAGDYELHLSEEEIRELLSSFADRDVLTVENDVLESMASTVRAQQGPAEPIEDHGVKTVVELRADSFTAPGETEPTLLEIDRTLEAQGLPTPDVLEATVDPEFRRLELFTRGVHQLEALAERSDLEAVDLDDDPAGRN